MRFQPVKCNMMQLTKKTKKIHASQPLREQSSKTLNASNYLGVKLTNYLRWIHMLAMFALRLTGPLDF